MSGLGFISATCVVVNMMIGAGFLALPQVFFSGGVVVSSLILAGMAYLLIVSCMWEGRSVLMAGRVLDAAKVPEVTEAFNVFMGPRWRDIYIFSLAFSLLSVNWALSILFAQTVSSSIPSLYHSEEHCNNNYAVGGTYCSTRYLMAIVILAVVTTPLAVTNIKEQWWIQNTLTAVRVARMLFMCITPLLVMSDEGLAFSFPNTFTDSDLESGLSNAIDDPPFFFGSWIGVCFVISASIFGMFLNGNIPIIIDSLVDKNMFASVLSTAFAVVLVLYLWLSMTVSMQFGSRTMTPCNLNWVGYRLPFWETCEHGSVCDSASRCLEFIIAFCPAIDVASAYPYISIVLGNSITEILFGMEEDCIRRHNVTETTPLQPKPQTTRNVELTDRAPLFVITPESYIVVNRLLRFAMNTFPLVLGAYIVNFSNVVQISGAVSVLVCLFFPAVLSIACKDDLSQHGLLITAENFVNWADNKLGSKYWATGTSKPQDSEAQEHKKIPKADYGVYEYLKFVFFFDYSVEGLNPEDDIIETSFTKKTTMLVGLIVMLVMLFVASN
jgi:amino acid permease